MGDKNFKWWAGGGSQPETYSGPLDTREEALVRGKADYPEGDFTICEADRAVVRFDMFDADQVLEQFEEHNLECWGGGWPANLAGFRQEARPGKTPSRYAGKMDGRDR